MEANPSPAETSGETPTLDDTLIAVSETLKQRIQLSCVRTAHPWVLWDNVCYLKSVRIGYIATDRKYRNTYKCAPKNMNKNFIVAFFITLQ